MKISSDSLLTPPKRLLRYSTFWRLCRHAKDTEDSQLNPSSQRAVAHYGVVRRDRPLDEVALRTLGMVIGEQH